MCTRTAGTGDPAGGPGFASVAEALRVAEEAMDFLNSPAALDLPGHACGDALLALGRIQAKQAAARAGFLRRFDAVDAHSADGYGSCAAWLAANGQLTQKDARAAVREMRRHAERPRLSEALRAGEITQSWADQIAAWTRKLPADLRDETDKILLDAAASGAALDDLAVLAAHAIEHWRRQRPDADDPDPDDRFVQVGTTFGGAGLIRGNLTPECATAVRAVIEALGKKQGPEDDRTEGHRFHDALQQACTLLLRARMVPARAGADTQAVVHIPLSQLRQMPGADDLEDAWIRARIGHDGCLTGQDAETAACDAQTVPVVTGTLNPAVIDQMIDLARAAAAAAPPTSGDILSEGRSGGRSGGGSASGGTTSGDTRQVPPPAAHQRTPQVPSGQTRRPGRGGRRGPPGGRGPGGPSAAYPCAAAARWVPSDTSVTLAALVPVACRPRLGGRSATRWPAWPLTWYPGRPGSPRCCDRACWTGPGTRRRCHWISATATASRPISAARSCCATGRARGPGAAARRSTATFITSATRGTGARPRSATASWRANSTTTCASIAAAGSSSFIPTAPPRPTAQTAVGCCTATRPRAPRPVS